ncbi:hypothetical protein ACLESO_49175, partial [Pyxidicoccus sp. 3LG]
MRTPIRSSRLATRLAAAAAAVLSLYCGNTPPPGERVPFTPASDAVVLERVPATAGDARARER